MRQIDTIRTTLDSGATLTAKDAWREFGIARLAARVRDLRDQNYPVVTRTIWVRTKSGRARVAQYVRGQA